MNDYFERVNIFYDKSELERLALEISIRGMQVISEIIDGCDFGTPRGFEKYDDLPTEEGE